MNSRPPRFPYATPSDLGLDATGRPGYEIAERSRFEDPDAKHHPACPCAECRLANSKADVHLEVPGKPYGVTSACGQYFGREMADSLSVRFSGTDGLNRPVAVTCVKCLAAARLRLVKAEKP